MSQCDTCGKTVLVGMIEEGELRFCSEKCHEVGRFREENPIPILVGQDPPDPNRGPIGGRPRGVKV